MISPNLSISQMYEMYVEDLFQESALNIKALWKGKKVLWLCNFGGHSEGTNSWSLPIFQQICANLHWSNTENILFSKSMSLLAKHCSTSQNCLYCAMVTNNPTSTCCKPQNITSCSHSMSVPGWLMLCSVACQFDGSWASEAAVGPCNRKRGWRKLTHWLKQSSSDTVFSLRHPRQALWWPRLTS